MGVSQRLEVYKCEVCGNIVEVLHVGGGELVCCGQPMKLQVEKTEDQGMEKHVPVIQKTDGEGIIARVGAVLHPMEEKHYIEWIELLIDGRCCRKFLEPGQKPEAQFECGSKDVTVRAYCNVHGLWMAKA